MTVNVSDNFKEIIKKIRRRFNHHPDGPDKTDYMIIGAYSYGREIGEKDPSEETRKAIRKEVLIELISLLDQKRTSLSEANRHDITAIAIGWLDVDILDLWDLNEIASLPAEFLGLVMKHQLWAEEARKEKENASD